MSASRKELRKPPLDRGLVQRAPICPRSPLPPQLGRSFGFKARGSLLDSLARLRRRGRGTGKQPQQSKHSPATAPSLGVPDSVTFDFLSSQRQPLRPLHCTRPQRERACKRTEALDCRNSHDAQLLVFLAPIRTGQATSYAHDSDGCIQFIS